MLKPIKTPCIGVCSTGLGDSVCRGCKRFEHEVNNWVRYSRGEKAAIDARLQTLLRQVVESKIRVVDAKLLRSQIEHQKIRYNPDHDCYCWVHDLLKAGASQIGDLTQFGCELRPEWRDRPLTDLKMAIDADFYALSCAHYERYFALTFAPTNG